MTVRLSLVLAFLGPTLVRADDSFTKGLTPAELHAAGLDKLTPAELEQLDALVRARQSGAVANAKDETTRAVTAQVRQQVKAEETTAAQRQAGPAGFLDRMKVVLRPGTDIEYTTLDAVLAGPFDGWRTGTILTLTNGQRWVVVERGSDYTTPTGKPVHVRIVPGSMGSFFMEIEGSGRPRVKFFGNTAPSQATRPEATK